MKEFFKPMRRKFGLLTLVVTLAFMLGWVRSLTEVDYIGIRPVDWIYSCGSFRGVLHFDTSTPFQNPPLLTWGAMKQFQFDKSFQTGNAKPDVWFFPEHERSDWFGRVYFGPFQAIEVPTARIVIPYWSFVIPLTFISLWLLVSKPSKLTTRKVSEPIPEMVK